MAYATVTLSGTYQTPDQTPHKGHVEIIPSERVIKDTTGDIILTGRVKVELDAQGAFTVALPATDDPTLNPTGFGYTIAAKLHSSHPPAVSFSLPAALGATTVEDLTPVDPSTFAPTTTYADASTVTALDSRVTTVETTKANSADLATVATSGNYTDLTGQPSIPTTAADVGALPDTTVIPATPGDVGAEPAGLSTTTTTNLNATYGPRRILGARLVGLGDSITAAGDSPTTRNESYNQHAALMSEGRLRFVRNAGIGGNTAAMMLARFDTDVTPYNPAVVTILAGANDSNQGVEVAQFADTMQALVAKVLDIGAVPVLMTAPPKNYAVGSIEENRVRDYNDWLRLYAARHGHLLVDVFAVVAESFQQFAWQASLDGGDGIHPNNEGHRRIGQALWERIEPLLAPGVPVLTQTKNDPNSLIPNGLMLNDTNADGLADGWAVWQSPTSGTATYSLVNDWANNIPGYMQRITLAGPAVGSAKIEQYLSLATLGVSVGDRIRVTGRFTSSGGVTTYIHVGITGTSTYYDWLTKAAVTRGVFEFEVTIEPGAQFLQLHLGAEDGAGTVDFGQVTLDNITKRNLPATG